jgi:hypothetical protein
MEEGEVSMLKDLAGIASVQLPGGFEKADEDCDFGHFIEFRHGQSRICYWQKDNFFASDESAQKLQECMKRRPHYIYRRDARNPMDPKVVEDEYFAAADALLQPGRVLPPIGFDLRNLRTQQLNGKTVFRAEFDGPRHFSSILMWDPTPESGILRHLWVDGPAKLEKEVQKDFEDIVSTIEWL